MKPYFVMRGKAMPEKLGRLAELMKQQLLLSKWDDAARLRELLLRTKAQFEQSLARNGLGIAMRRLGSYLSNRGAYQDLTSGFGFYQFLSDICREPDLKTIAAKLKAVQAKLINRNGLQVGVTCQDEQLPAVRKALPAMLAAIAAGEFKPVGLPLCQGVLERRVPGRVEGAVRCKGERLQETGFSIQRENERAATNCSPPYISRTPSACRGVPTAALPSWTTPASWRSPRTAIPT